jgi:multidrug/hemolysin transport system ATP-binding protein
MNRPEILFLDEPTTGLDPQTRQNVWASVERLRNEDNMTVFLTTHYMEEAAKAQYVSIMEAGRIAAEGTPQELKVE